jgi:membrane dipeptidase
MMGIPPLADLHVDTLHRAFEDGADLVQGSAGAHVDVPRQRAAGVRLLGLSIWSRPGPEAPARCRALLDLAHELLARPGAGWRLLESAPEDGTEPQGSACWILLGVEGAHGLEDSLEVLEAYVQRGLRWLTLTWNNANALADSCMEPREPGGLTRLGRQFVDLLRRRGAIVDLAHASPRTFWDALEAAPERAWVSHAGCRALADHPRNLTDDQIRALGEAGSVVGLVFHPRFLRPEAPETATLEDVADHIEHAVRVGGPQVVAIGSDMDGVPALPQGLEDTTGLARLLEILQHRGWTPAMLRALAWENALRVVRRALPTGEA